MPRQKRTEIVCPFTVLVDNNEQIPYRFTGLHADSRQNNLPLIITVERANLHTGDYSIKDHHNRVMVERKSLADLFSTLSQGRARFEDELLRMNDPKYFPLVSAVVVEADLETILKRPPPLSQLNPKSVVRSMIAWQQRFPFTHWWLAPNRRTAESLVFRILERYYRDNVEILSNRKVRHGGLQSSRSRNHQQD
jgi:ERCC4-type nuclease